MDLEEEGKELTEFRTKYNQCKAMVVKWEIAFGKEKGRNPTRADFSLAPRTVRLAYSTYLQIKHLLSKLSRNGGLAGLRPGSAQLKKTPVDSPHKIFRRYNSSSGGIVRDGVTEEFNPPPKPKPPSSLMDGITSLPPLPKGVVPLCPETQASLPYFRFSTPRRKKDSTGNESGLPFGKLTSKLFVLEAETESIPIPRGNLGRSRAEEEHQPEQEPDPDPDFTNEIQSILMDVRKAVEMFDNEDFGDGDTDGVTSSLLHVDFGLVGSSGEGDDVGRTQPNAQVNSAPLALSFSSGTLPENNSLMSSIADSEHSFFSDTFSFKQGSLNSKWIDRCNLGTREHDLDQDDSTGGKEINCEEDGNSSMDLEMTLTENMHLSSAQLPNTPPLPAISNLLHSPILSDSVPRTGTEGGPRRPRLLRVRKPENSQAEVPRGASNAEIGPPPQLTARMVERSEVDVSRGASNAKIGQQLRAKKSEATEMVVAPGASSKKKPTKKKSKKDSEPRVSVPKRKAIPKRKAAEISDYDFLDDQGENSAPKNGRKRIKLTRRPGKEKKMNDNFVRIDVAKNVFVRGRKKMTGVQHKKLDWKLRKNEAAAESRIQLMKCRKCGEVGHFAKSCVKAIQKETELISEEVDDSPFPSLEEVARMFWSKKALEASQTRTCVYETLEPAKIGMEPEVGECDLKATTVSQNSDVTGEYVEATLVLVSSLDEDSEADKSMLDDSQSLDTTTQSHQSASSEFDPFLLDASIDAGIAVTTMDGMSSLPQPTSSSPSSVGPGSSLPPEDEEMVQKALELFGYKEFRSGQKEAITRVLLGQTTMVVLSTGTGKSLCYLLPAYIYAKKYPGVLTICVSPLVSLMEDQVQSIPPFLEGACLHTKMSAKQREVVMERIRQKKLQVLLVSPEAVCGGLFGLLRNVHEFPTVAFACVDEVHCVSEWSHNFRPSYLRLCQILRDRLNVKTILGLTATATNHTISSACEHLRLDPATVITGEIIPTNLRLSCSRDMNREEALIMLLRSKRFEQCDSIIIYCTRREQCENIATLIRRVMTTEICAIIKGNSRRRISAECETYHAGMSAALRRSVQNNFMAGKIRIIVATVAFGMGIDKSDIRAVIHYNMPKTFESYVQEIGRAGRDGLPAECHLFLDTNKGKDINELKRHIYSNSVDRSTLRKLLSRIFKPCTCQQLVKIKSESQLKGDQKKPCPGHEVSFSVDKTVQELDLPEENIETLLCYLERYPSDKKLVEVLPKCYHLCSIQSYKGTKLLKSTARTSAALGAAIAIQMRRKKFKDDDVHLSFNFVEVASLLGWPSAQMRKELKSLEWTGSEFDKSGNPIRFRKSGLLIEYSDLAYRMVTPGTLSDEEADKILNFLHERNLAQERLELFQLNRVYQALSNNSHKSVETLCDSYDEIKSDNLKKLILEYFSSSEVGVPAGWNPPISRGNTEKEEMIRQDVRKLLESYRDEEFSSRSIAKIFQGISSPRFPAEDWCRNKSFWRRHVDVDFPFLCQIAAHELIS